MKIYHDGKTYDITKAMQGLANCGGILTDWDNLLENISRIKSDIEHQEIDESTFNTACDIAANLRWFIDTCKEKGTFVDLPKIKKGGGYVA